MSKCDRPRGWHLGRVWVVVIAGVMGAWAFGQPGPALGQAAARVAPDANVLAAIQAMQAVLTKKDAAKYDQVLAKDMCVSLYSDKGEREVVPQPRDQIIKELNGTAEGANASPFIDGTPLSKRILYAQNIPGGQRVRILLLNRTSPKAAESVNWVMDLNVTRQGGAAGPFMLSEICLLPEDFGKAVFFPVLTDQLAGKLTEAQATVEFNKLWAKFAATMPKPEAMPVGPTGTPRPVLPTPTPALPTPTPFGPIATPRPTLPPSSAISLLPTPGRRPVPPPPPPPMVRIPTLATAFTTLPKPPAPVLLPAEQATQRVQNLRTQIDDIVRKNFVDFVGRPLSEQYSNRGGRRIYYNTYQNRVRVSFGPGITLVITINLVFVQPPRGPMTTFMVPTVEPDQPEQPMQPPVIPQTPISLPPPPAASVGCMVLTDTAKLKAKHGADRFDEISRYLSSFGKVIDLAGRNIAAGDFKAVDAVVKQNFDRAKCDCLFIFGNHDMVPFASYPNPTMGQGGDPDPFVWSDDLYADFDHDAQADPEIMVVRMPDDPGILADPNSVLYRPSATAQRIALADYAIYGNTHRSSPPLLAKFAEPDHPELLERSTPLTADDFSKGFFSGLKMNPMPPPDIPPSIQKPQKSSPNSHFTRSIRVCV